MIKDQSTNRHTKQRTLKGVVVSDKMQKTIVVEVSRMKKHPKYKKYFKVTKRFKVHDEENTHKTGDRIFIKESKPISKEKRWIVINKVE